VGPDEEGNLVRQGSVPALRFDPTFYGAPQFRLRRCLHYDEKNQGAWHNYKRPFCSPTAAVWPVPSLVLTTAPPTAAVLPAPAFQSPAAAMWPVALPAPTGENKGIQGFNRRAHFTSQEAHVAAAQTHFPAEEGLVLSYTRHFTRCGGWMGNSQPLLDQSKGSYSAQGGSCANYSTHTYTVHSSEESRKRPSAKEIGGTGFSPDNDGTQHAL